MARPLPENILNAQFHVRVRPSPEWLKANSAASDDEPIPDDQMLVQLVSSIEWIQTSALTKPSEWPAQLIEIGVLKTLTLGDLKRLAVQQLAAARGINQATS